jgi:hypothetical protein
MSFLTALPSVFTLVCTPLMCCLSSSWLACMSLQSSLRCLIINCSDFFHHESHFWHQFVMYGGFYSQWIFISTPKLKTLQLITTSNSPNMAGQSIVGLSVHL